MFSSLALLLMVYAQSARSLDRQKYAQREGSQSARGTRTTSCQFAPHRPTNSARSTQSAYSMVSEHSLKSQLDEVYKVRHRS
jgi:hypothetical protein